MLVNVVKYGSYPTPVHGYIPRTILDLFQVNIDIYSAEASFKKEG